MPEEPDDDGLVPPIKVMRKRLNGVYSAEGFAGPTRRYVLIVAMLVGLASLPTLAAITAGSRELDDGRSGALDVPFIPPASTGPVQVPAPSPSTGADSTRPAVPPTGSPDPGGSVQGQASKRKIRPRPGAPVKSTKGYAHSTRAGSPGPSASAGSSAAPDRGESWRSRPSRPGSGPAGSDSGSKPAGPGSGPAGGGSAPVRPAPVRPPAMPSLPAIPVKPKKPNEPVGSGDGDTPDDDRNNTPGDRVPGDEFRGDRVPGDQAPGDQVMGDGSSDGDGHGGSDAGGDAPDPPAEPGHPPWCLDRDDCRSRPSQRDHHRPDRPRHQDCDHGRRHERSTQDLPAEQDAPALTIYSISIRTTKVVRSDSRRRSTVTELPQNVRPARSADRTHNSHRYQPFAAVRGDGTQTTIATRAHRGSHRADRMHGTDDRTGAYHRSSRMGRHHGEPRKDHQDHLDHQQKGW